MLSFLGRDEYKPLRPVAKTCKKENKYKLFYVDFILSGGAVVYTEEVQGSPNAIRYVDFLAKNHHFPLVLPETNKVNLSLC